MLVGVSSGYIYQVKYKYPTITPQIVASKDSSDLEQTTLFSFELAYVDSSKMFAICLFNNKLSIY